MLKSSLIALYERRIDNCFFARARCKKNSWGYKYWTKTAAYLLRQLNRKLHTDIRYDSSKTYH